MARRSSSSSKLPRQRYSLAGADVERLRRASKGFSLPVSPAVPPSLGKTLDRHAFEREQRRNSTDMSATHTAWNTAVPDTTWTTALPASTPTAVVTRYTGPPAPSPAIGQPPAIALGLGTQGSFKGSPQINSVSSAAGRRFSSGLGLEQLVLQVE